MIWGGGGTFQREIFFLWNCLREIIFSQRVASRNFFPPEKGRENFFFSISSAPPRSLMVIPLNAFILNFGLQGPIKTDVVSRVPLCVYSMTKRLILYMNSISHCMPVRGDNWLCIHIRAMTVKWKLII